jgi:pyroglutamyl-peptidase
MRTILVTGFGPFPGAPVNPTGAVVKALARLRRPHLRIAAHVFETKYAAVDRELPALLKTHRPDALLMLGLHGRAKTLRIETLARNALGRARDAGGAVPGARRIVAKLPHLKMRTPARRLAQAARRSGTPAIVSRDAGSYLCNYLCWRATEAAGAKTPRLAAFVHVPPVSRKALRHGRHAFTPATLERAAVAILDELAHCLGSGRMDT